MALALAALAAVIIALWCLRLRAKRIARQLPFIQDIIDGFCPRCGDLTLTIVHDQFWRQCSCSRCGFKVRVHLARS